MGVIYLNGIPYSSGTLYTDIIGTLEAGETEITLTNSAIDSSKTFDFYTTIPDISPTNISISNESITLTFDAQQNDIQVKVRVW